MVLYSMANRPVSTPEVNSGVVKVETCGYVSAKRQIEAMIRAGERLQASRAEMYDGMEDDYPIDPTRQKELDPVDADISHRLYGESVKAFLERRNKALEARKASTPAPTPATPEKVA